MKILAALALSLVAGTASATPSAAVCSSIRLPFALPSARASSSWGDADYQAWLDRSAARYCASRPGSAWCSCYSAGLIDY